MPVAATPMRPRPEREHRVLGVARVVVDGAVARSAARGWPGPPNCRWSARSCAAGGWSSVHASSSQRCPTSVSARPWMRPPQRDTGRGATPVVAQLPVVAEHEPAGGIGERLGVGQLEGRELRRSPVVDERRRGLDSADGPSRTGVVAEGPDVAIGLEPAIGRPATRRPSEAGQPVALESLAERPQLIEAERIRGPRDEVLAHRGRW